MTDFSNLKPTLEELNGRYWEAFDAKSADYMAFKATDMERAGNALIMKLQEELREALNKPQLSETERQLMDLCWDLHVMHMRALINLASERNVRADDVWAVMDSEDRKVNNQFLDVLFPLMNPHLAKDKANG